MLNSDLVAENGLRFFHGSKPLQYMKEIMPLEFNSDRSNRATGRFIFEKNLGNISAVLKVPFVRAESENIVFMESEYA